MRILKVHVKNFRLLSDVSLCLEKAVTVVVGRNNTGKTSLTELFRRVLSESSPTFRFEDFSLNTHSDFWDAFSLHTEGAEDDTVRDRLPTIETTLTVSYDGDMEYGPLSGFIIDLDEKCSQACIRMRYELEPGKIEPLFASLEQGEAKKAAFFRAMKERVPTHYRASLEAVDPGDDGNTKAMDFGQLRALLQSGFINAQRGLDDTTSRDRDTLSKILQALLEAATAETASEADRTIAEDLGKAVEGIQDGIGKGFNEQLKRLLPAFNLFGYPGLSDPDLHTETTLEVDRLLKDNTKVRYAGVNGLSLPEAYNGLGVRNLIFILLKLLEFFKAFQAKQPAAGVHLVFIEEPEAHLHPQMQEVFLRKIPEIAKAFADTYSPNSAWPVQFVVTTHSSHMANEAPFDAMRYFLTRPSEDGHTAITDIKDLRVGLAASRDDQEFLHQYMTLTRCDLLFADKALLVEGTSERLMRPRLIEKVDQDLPAGDKLASQYIAVMEVGGAYAHRFHKLLDFLELRTLIITDLDAINHQDGNRACKVSEGTRTSNGCLKEWFCNDISPQELIGKAEDDKINGSRRLAYQVPESKDDPCGRTFEDAFILANAVLFGVQDAEDSEQAAWDTAKGVKKSEFAIKYAIEDTNWVVPRYIKEGLLWLAIGADPNDAHGNEAESDQHESIAEEPSGA